MAMADDRELSAQPLVALDAGKLLGMRHLAQVSARRAGDKSRDLNKSAGGASESRADMSRLFSKIGLPPET